MKHVMLMAGHFAALQMKRGCATVAGAPVYEIREAPGADMAEIARTIDRLGTAFDEYKKANDERLAEVAKKGVVSPETEAKLARINAELDEMSDVKRRLEAVETRAGRPGGAGDRTIGTQLKEEGEYRSAFEKWLRNPREAEQRLWAATKELQTKYRSMGLEQKAVQTATLTGAAGGFALPEQIEQTIARLTVDVSPIRSIATVRTVGTPDYKELFDVNGAAFEWVGETGTRSQTATPDLAEVAPTFGMASARPRASEESLDDLFFDVEGWLQQSVAETLALGEGTAFVSGNGTNRPTGFLAGPAAVATDDKTRAFGTLQYIPTLVAGALPASADTFYDLIYSLRARYRANARFVTSKVVLAGLRKYKDSTGQYLWQPSLSLGQPENFMGYPITEAEDMPAIAANAIPLAFGDFREGYLIADRVGIRVTRDEITLPGFVQWYVRRRVGGKVRNSPAIKLLKCAVS
jgi:HK97 family phage major capsid protein